MTARSWLNVLALGAAVLWAGSSQARAAETAAVFPFELLDSSQEGEIVVKVRHEETARLKQLTDDLKTRLAKLGNLYTLVDTAPIEAEIKSQAPLYKCNGCESDLARKIGAKLAIVGLVQKFSDTLLSVNLQIVDAATGTVRAAYNAGVQGNTDEAWLRGVSHIVRNRLTPESSQ